ncbi:MAG: 2-oxo acid dehydrogenase subunit E2, partial [Planctomycetota bacterium]|nr:2-oxo acid dehydrogenase subunit E2 [Planctomycetota bacterium]
VSINDMIIKACGLALRRFPRVASVYTPQGNISRDRIHVGFAVALDNEGLVVPVVRDVDRKSLAQIAADTKVLIDKARSNRLTVDDYSGGIFTVSNLGTFDVEHFTAIINPGESAILAVGKICEKPVALKGAIAVRHMMNITLSSDHRTIDGVLAARFAGCVKELLEKPEALMG